MKLFLYIIDLLLNHCNKFQKDEESFVSEIFTKILENFNSEKFNIPAYYQETRFYSLKTLFYCLENFNKKKFFKSKEVEFVQILLDAVEGEKDPRNILIKFQLMARLCNLLDKTIIKEYSKNIFNTLEIYYPIEFTPPKNSPEKITAENLIDELNEAFASNENFMESMIELFADKISSTVIETKLEVMKTIKKINQKYSSEIFNAHLVTILNLILNQILNNEDEYLHIESIITFKEIIKKFYDDIANKNFEFLSDDEKHILLNIEKIYEKSEDLIFHSENVKNSFDAKDLIVVIVEFSRGNNNINSDSILVNDYRERAFRLSLKLIQTYLEDPKVYYLKNSNTILFFVFKNDYKMDDSLTKYITQHSSTVKNILFNLIKKNVTSSDERENVVDIVSAFIVKSDLFSFEEVNELFNKIFNVWRDCDDGISNHLGLCLNEIIVKYNELNNLNFVCKFIEAGLKENMNNSSITSDDNNVNKYFNLLKNYFSNPKISNVILKFLFENVIKLAHKTKMNSYTSSVGSVINKISLILVEIFSEKKYANYFKDYEADKILHEFIEKINNAILRSESKSEYFQKNVFKDLIHLIDVLFSLTKDETILNQLNLVVDIFDSMMDKKEIHNSIYRLGKYSDVHFYLKFVKLILKKFNPSSSSSDINYELFTIIHENIVNNLFNLIMKVQSNLEKNSDKKDISLFTYTKVSKLLAKSLYSVKITINKLTNQMDDENDADKIPKIYTDLKKIFDNILSRFNEKFIELEKDLTNPNITDIKQNTPNEFLLTFNLKFVFFSSMMNSLILIEDSNSVYFMSSIFDKIIKIDNDKIFEILSNSSIFKLKDNSIDEIDKDVIYQKLYKLKEYYELFGSGSNRLNAPQKFLLHCLLNLYSSFSDSMIDENFDIIIDLTIKTLDIGIDIKSSASLMKKILKFIDKDFVRRKGYNTKNLIESFLKHFEQSDDMQTKIDLLTCLYKFKLVIPNWEEKLIKHVIRKLRPGLKNKKRLVRKLCGMCITIWNMNE